MHQNINNSTSLHQSVKITTELKRALLILSMPVESLSEFVNGEIASNPLYELPYKSHDTSSIKSDIPIPYQESLYEKMINQARITFSKEELKITKLLVSLLDHKGFLTESLEDIAYDEQIDLISLETAQKKLTKLSPLGIGSENRRDFFLLQLEEKNKKETLCFKLVKQYYNALINQRYSEIQKKEKISKKMIQKEIERELKPLKMQPLEAVFTPRFVRADIVVHEEANKLTILIDDEGVYPVSIASTYQNLFTSNTLNSPEKKYLINALSSGNWLIKNLKMRRDTLYKITKILVEEQKDFFLEGRKVKPLTIKEVAKKINLSPSTISRCVQNKYIKTPFGLFPLKHFFIHQCKTAQSSILDKLKKVIENEDRTNPLTDQQICEKLCKGGIKVSRRCISKYRNSLNILSAKKRQKH